MVFKAVSGVKENVYSTYTSGQTYHEKVLAALDVTNSYLNDYKNRIVLKWKDFGASEVKIICLVLLLIKYMYVIKMTNAKDEN